MFCEERLWKHGGLVCSIKQHGLLQPLVVRPVGSKLSLVCGQRRLIACKILRWKSVPCVVGEMGEKEAFEISLTENLQRKTLNPIEEARAYRQYIELTGWGSAQELAIKIGKSPEYVSHRIALLRLPEQVLHDVEAGKIAVSSAYELLGLEHDEEQVEFARQISETRLSSKTVRKVIRALRQDDASNVSAQDLTYMYPEHENTVSDNTLSAVILIYRVTLARLDKVINDCGDSCIQKYLIDQRYCVHSLIDNCLKIREDRVPELN